MSGMPYVNSTNAQLYIGGILIDDVFDCQYTYKETKEPIYGYNSKYFDRIVKGNVIVHGSFSINYRHDGYLSQILKRVKGDYGDIGAAQSRIESAKAYNTKYIKLLSSYKLIDNQIKDAKEILKINQLGLQGQELTYNSTKNIADRKIAEAENASTNAYNEYSDLYENLTQEEADALQQYYNTCTKLREDREYTLGLIDNFNNNIASLKTEILSGLSEELRQSKLTEIADYEQGITNLTLQNKEYSDELNNQLSNLSDDFPNVASLISAQVNSDDLDAVSATVTETEEAFVETDSDILSAAKSLVTESNLKIANLQAKKKDLIKEIEQLKLQMNELLPNWDTLSSQDATKTNVKQPEDLGSFSLFIRINSMTHIILEDCEIMAHGLPIPGGSGESLKQQYSFIARLAR